LETGQAIADLDKLGLTVERSENKILLAVDVPPSVNQQEIDDYLVEQEELGRWQMQDGFLSSIKTASTRPYW
jgi:RNA:NAD 2'-phosphotransferase (TPT1/KptA family)